VSSHTKRNLVPTWPVTLYICKHSVWLLNLVVLDEQVHGRGFLTLLIFCADKHIPNSKKKQVTSNLNWYYMLLWNLWRALTHKCSLMYFFTINWCEIYEYLLIVPHVCLHKITPFLTNTTCYRESEATMNFDNWENLCSLYLKWPYKIPSAWT
jgi:hypothetical protein